MKGGRRGEKKKRIKDGENDKSRMEDEGEVEKVGREEEEVGGGRTKVEEKVEEAGGGQEN
jgi:hypothetical protein